MSHQGRAITAPEREMIIRVMDFFEEEKRIGDFTIPVGNVLSRTSKATGVSDSTLKRIRRELDDSRKRAGISGKLKTRTQRTYSSSIYTYSDVILKGLKQIVDSYKEVNGKMISLDDALAEARKYLNFPGTRVKLQKVLVETLGYDCYDDAKNDNLAKSEKTYNHKAKLTDEVLEGLKKMVDDHVTDTGQMMTLDEAQTAAKEYLTFPIKRCALRDILVEKLGYNLEKDFKKHERMERGEASTSESEDKTGNLKNEQDFQDPILLCEVDIKEELT